VDAYEAQESWPDAFERFASAVDLRQVRALVVGGWEEAYEEGTGAEIVQTLVDARDRLPGLRALFLADMTYEECEISWIAHGDITPLLTAFPDLEVFGIRGATGLALQPVRHAHLRELTMETGGLPAAVVRAVAGCDLPALTSLKLWLGTSEYGGDSTVDDIAPILAGTRLPVLRHLGLCDSQIQDEVAAACATAPVVAQLKELDLSMGVLTDAGALALLGGQSLTHLQVLDLTHNFLTEEVVQQVRDALEPAGVRLELDPDDAEEYTDDDGVVTRFVSVGE
jgi:hypothetical protein